MMFLSRLETRRRVKVFDAIVEQTDHALRHPDVIAMLGDTATQLAALNRNVFLPDLRHGELVVPKSQVDTKNVAFYPAKRAELDNAATAKLVNKISEQQVLSWNLEGAMHAMPYGISRTYDEIIDYFNSEESKDLREEGDGVPPPPATSPDGRTRIRFGVTVASLETPGPGRFTSSRPVICMWDKLAETRSLGVSTAAHEEVHAFDALNFAPVVSDDFGRVAGELRAYHVEGVIGRAFGGEGELNEVEAFRREHADPMRPFYPTEAMVDIMRAERRILPPIQPYP